MDDSNKLVQELTLQTLDVLTGFLDSHGLRYYFTGGALIGVLRHKGFIPWDDDIDLGLPRKDYDRFQQLIRQEMPEGYGICNRFTDKTWHFAMSQFVDLESEIEIDLAEKTRRAHIWIDVFPLDGLPSGRVRRWIRVRNIMLHRYLVQIANISTQVDAHRKRPLKERIVLAFCKAVPVGRLIRSDRVLDHLEKVLRKDDFYTSAWCGNMLGRYREKEVVRQEWFGEPVKAPFEGRMVSIPQNSHAVQQTLYGDYMQLPPKEDRVAHNVKILRCRTISEKERR